MRGVYIGLALGIPVAGALVLAWLGRGASPLTRAATHNPPTHSAQLLLWEDLSALSVGKMPPSIDGSKLRSTLIRIVGYPVQNAQTGRADVITLSQHRTCGDTERVTDTGTRAYVDMPPGAPLPRECQPLYVEGFLRFPMELMATQETLVSANTVRAATAGEIAESHLQTEELTLKN